MRVSSRIASAFLVLTVSFIITACLPSGDRSSSSPAVQPPTSPVSKVPTIGPSDAIPNISAQFANQ
jgi:hypothetical protein